MTLEFDKLAYPGMFAQLGETGWVQVDRPTGWEASNNKICFRVQGVNEEGESLKEENIELDLDTPNPLQHLLEVRPFLAGLEFEPYDSNNSCTRQVASIIAELKGLGVEDIVISFSRRDKIKSIKMPFTPEVWADLGNKEGEYLPACCGNISAARDEYLSGQREDGYMEAESIHNIVELISSSHSEMFDDEEGYSEPVNITKRIWDLIQPVADIHLGARPLNSSDVNDAIYMLGSFSNMYNWNSITSEFPTFNDRVCVTDGLHTIIPAIKTIVDKIHELDLGPIEGFAICPRHGDDDTFRTRMGLAIWRTQEEAETTLKRWIDTDQIEAGEVLIRPVRISIDKGLEFLGEIESPWVDLDQWEPMVTTEEYKEAEGILEALEQKLGSEMAKRQVRFAKANLKSMTERFNPKQLRKP